MPLQAQVFVFQEIVAVPAPFSLPVALAVAPFSLPAVLVEVVLVVEVLVDAVLVDAVRADLVLIDVIMTSIRYLNQIPIDLLLLKAFYFYRVLGFS